MPERRDLTVWSGPINATSFGGSVPGSGTIRFVSCTGDGFGGTPVCRSFADKWADQSGRRLPGMFQQFGLRDADVGNLILGAFSAGSHLWRRILAGSPADRARVRALLLTDATYSAGGTPSKPEPVSGFIEFALDALRDTSKMFIATASDSPNKNYGSASQVLAATMREIERLSGARFKEGGRLPTTEQPERLFTSPAGNIIFAHYGMKGGGHGYHPKLAPELWTKVMQPWLHRSPLADSWPWLAGAAGVAAGFALAATLMRA